MNSCWCDIDAVAARLEAVVIRSILDLSLISTIIDISILSLHLAIRSFCLDLEASVGRFIAIAVASIFVVTVDLFQNRNGRCVLLLREARTSQADEHENLAKPKRQISNHFQLRRQLTDSFIIFFDNFKNCLLTLDFTLNGKKCLAAVQVYSRFQRSTD